MAKKSQKRSVSKKSKKRSASKKSQKRSASKKSQKRSASKKSSRRRGVMSMKKRMAQADNPCRSYKKVNCGSVNPNCTWRARAGCVRRKGAATKGLVYEGPSMMEQ